ncbi:hypothetical protein OROGR_014374 [Orobanche gracilis]
MADWSALPQELLHLISLFLTTSIDFLHFRSVCTTWRASVQPRLCPVSSNPIVPPPGYLSRFNLTSTFTFYLAKQTIFALPWSYTRNDDNPSWIIRVGQDINSAHIHHLHHPLTFSPIKLPQTFPRPFSFSNLKVLELGESYTVGIFDFLPIPYTVPKISVHQNLYQYRTECFGIPKSGIPKYRYGFRSIPIPYRNFGITEIYFGIVLNKLDNTFVALAIEDLRMGKLIVYKSGAEEWRVIKDDFPLRCCHVIAMGGKFYAVENNGRLTCVNHMDLSLETIVASPRPGPFEEKSFLKDPDDEFAIFELGVELFRLDENGINWVEVNDLGGIILFVGEACTFSATAKDIFGETGTAAYCKGNCIFYGGYDGTYCFSLETRTMKLFDRQDDPSMNFWAPPA